MNQKPLVSIPEAGILLGISRATAYRWAKYGVLPLLQTSNHRWLVLSAELMRVLDGLPAREA